MNSKTLIAVGLLTIVILIVVLVIVGSSSKPSVTTSTTNTVVAVAAKPLVGANDIVGDPLVYDGLRVEVESQVSEWVTKKSFKVTTSTGGLFGGGKSLLVIAKDPFDLPQNNSITKLGLGEKVRVHLKGRVAIVNKDQLEQYLGVDFKSDEFIKLDDNHLVSWTLGPVLLLESVEKI